MNWSFRGTQSGDVSVGEAPKDARRVGGEYGGGENLRSGGKNLRPVGGERGTCDQVKNMCATGREEEEGWEDDEGGRDGVVAKASIGELELLAVNHLCEVVIEEVSVEDRLQDPGNPQHPVNFASCEDVVDPLCGVAEAVPT